MSDLTQMLTVGTLLIIETGEYSSRDWAGPVIVRRAFVKADAAERFKREWVPGPNSWRDAEDGPGEDEFLPWLVKEGYVSDPDMVVHAWHVGHYGRFDP